MIVMLKKNNLYAILLVGALLALGMIGGTYLSFFSSSVVNENEILGCKNVERQYNKIPSAAFELLPFHPKCAQTFFDAFHAGNFNDVFFFTPDYYLQPEFFPDFALNGASYWINPNASHYGIIGFGVFPPKKEIILHSMQPQIGRIFMHSGYGVRTLQGVRVKVVFDNPEDARLISIELDENSSQGFLLGPNFPKFERNWVKPITITVTPSSITAKKTIKVRLVSASPQNEIEKLAETFSYSYFPITAYAGERTITELEIRIE